MSTTNNERKASEDKQGIASLNNFLNDPCWMDNYGYKTFSSSEIAKLYSNLKGDKKLNLHREAVVSYALKMFPHRASKNQKSFKQLYILGGICATAGVVVILTLLH